MSAAVTLIDLSHGRYSIAEADSVANSPSKNDAANQQSANSVVTAAADQLKSGDPSIVSLPDPSHGEERDYLVIPSPTGNFNCVDIMEVQGLESPSKYSSYFVGSRVVSDGTCRVATRVDPLFFVLAAVEAKLKQFAAAGSSTNSSSSGPNDIQSGGPTKWQPLDQILADVPPIVRAALRNSSTNAQLSPEDVLDRQMRNLFHMTDQFGDDLILYKYDEKKAKSWLKAKHAQALAAAEAGILRAKLRADVEKVEASKLGGGSGAFSSAFNMGDEDDEENEQKPIVSPSNSASTSTSPSMGGGDVTMLTKVEEDQARAAALQLICEYLSDEWRNKLIEELSMKEEDLLGSRGKKRKAATSDNADDDSIEGKSGSQSQWSGGDDAVDKMLQITRGIDGCGGAAGNADAIAMDEEEREKAKKKEEKLNAKSVGLKKLAKVNTKGMKSLSSFFGASKKKKKV